MAITLRKVGSGPAKVPPVSPLSAGGEYKSPFRESYHAEEKDALALSSADSKPAAAPATAPAPVGKPKAVFKITPGKSVKPGLPAVTPVSPEQAKADTALVQAGLASEPTSKDLYPPVSPGEFVRITNSLFPWVQHYKPGDIARVMYSSPAHTHPEDPFKYRAYVLEIVDGPRKGQKPFLFRWEFEPRDTSQPPPRIEGRVISQS